MSRSIQVSIVVVSVGLAASVRAEGPSEPAWDQVVKDAKHDALRPLGKEAPRAEILSVEHAGAGSTGLVREGDKTYVRHSVIAVVRYRGIAGEVVDVPVSLLYEKRDGEWFCIGSTLQKSKEVSAATHAPEPPAAPPDQVVVDGVRRHVSRNARTSAYWPKRVSEVAVTGKPQFSRWETHYTKAYYRVPVRVTVDDEKKKVFGGKTWEPRYVCEMTAVSARWVDQDHWDTFLSCGPGDVDRCDPNAHCKSLW
jgi:hypothetical protein